MQGFSRAAKKKRTICTGIWKKTGVIYIWQKKCWSGLVWMIKENSDLITCTFVKEKMGMFVTVVKACASQKRSQGIFSLRNQGVNRKTSVPRHESLSVFVAYQSVSHGGIDNVTAEKRAEQTCERMTSATFLGMCVWHWGNLFYSSRGYEKGKKSTVKGITVV